MDLIVSHEGCSDYFYFFFITITLSWKVYLCKCCINFSGIVFLVYIWVYIYIYICCINFSGIYGHSGATWHNYAGVLSMPIPKDNISLPQLSHVWSLNPAYLIEKLQKEYLAHRQFPGLYYHVLKLHKILRKLFLHNSSF